MTPSMERRTFLASVAVGVGAAGTGAVWLPGCGAAAGRSVRPLGSREAADLADRLARGLRTVREAPFAAPGAPVPWSSSVAARDAVMRLGLEALVVADVVRSIPPGTTIPDPLARPVAEALPILDRSVATYYALLARTPPAVRRNVDRRFAERPALAMEIAEVLDGRAREIGISTDSRIRLRSSAANVGLRIRRQSSNALVDDCLAKVDRVVGQSGADLRLASHVTTTALVDRIWLQVDAASGVRSPSAPAAHVVDPEVPPAQPEPAAPGDGELITGGILLGCGLASFGVGGIVSAATSSLLPFAIAATPGSVLTLLGLIFLIVGAVQNAEAG